MVIIYSLINIVVFDNNWLGVIGYIVDEKENKYQLYKLIINTA